ncbi:hypothetical protein THUN1379_04900 [Paludibacterium sp. THUN1379]|nr:hypothetical protein THUN1379_04900 [Paludibacterium sp. THUN1379]
MGHDDRIGIQHAQGGQILRLPFAQNQSGGVEDAGDHDSCRQVLSSPLLDEFDSGLINALWQLAFIGQLTGQGTGIQ